MNCTTECDFSATLRQGATNYSCQQMLDYCSRLTEWTAKERKISLGVYNSQIFFGAFGFLCYILMWLTLRLQTFQGPSYLYHKSMVCMEFLHMAVMLQAGIISPINFTETDSYIVYRDFLLYMWVFGDAMKLSVTSVTTFLSMERCIAIWSPNMFSHINKSRIVWYFIAISTLVGLLHLSPALCGYPAPDPQRPGLYIKQLNAYGRSGINDVISALIYAVKIGTCIAIFIFCIFVAVGLIVKSRKAETLTSTGKDKWSSTRRLCILQMVVAISTLVDHVTWVINKVINDHDQNDIVGPEAIVRLTYADALADIDHREIYIWTWMVQSVTGEIDHCGRFILYLIFMKKFREAFISLIKTGDQPAHVFTISNHSRAVKVAPVPIE